jgi:hypothetical protein
VEKATKEVLHVPYMDYSGGNKKDKIVQQATLFHLRDEETVGLFTDEPSSTSTVLKPVFTKSLSNKDYVMFDYKLQPPTWLPVIAVVKASDPQTNIQIVSLSHSGP